MSKPARFYPRPKTRREPAIDRFDGFQSNVLGTGGADSFASMGQSGYVRPRTIAEQKRLEAEALLQEAEHAAHEARRRAEEVLEEARRKGEEIEAQAYQAGFRQGEEAGRSLGEQKIETIVRSLKAVLDEVVSQKAALIKKNEEELVRLAFLIALKLIHREIRQDPAVVLDVARAAMGKVRRASRLTLYVSPHDAQFIREHLGELRPAGEEEAEVTIETDSAIRRGGCRIVCDTGEVDATIERMIQDIKSQIWED